MVYREDRIVIVDGEGGIKCYGGCRVWYRGLWWPWKVVEMMCLEEGRVCRARVAWRWWRGLRLVESYSRGSDSACLPSLPHPGFASQASICGTSPCIQDIGHCTARACTRP